MKKIFVLLFAAMILSATADAAAPSTINDVSIRISYSDLNIDNDAGAKKLYSRLRNAAEQACGLGSYLDLGSLAAISTAKKCYVELLDKAVTRIDHEQLTRLHES